MVGGGGGGGHGVRTPANFPPRQKARLPRGPVHEKSLEQQKKGPSSSSPSVSSNKSPLQLAAAIVQPQKPLESPQHMVTPVRLQESPGPRTIPCSSGSVGSGSGAAPFDICIKRDDKCSIKLSRSLLEINREKRREREQLSKEAAPLQYLRPGMVLMKKFLKHDDQVDIIRRCQKLGIGSGGFYTPGYRDGGKLSFQMMCLGKNWDPNSRSYGDTRPFDGAQPPSIPEVFSKIVKDAIQASNEFLRQKARPANDVEELPPLSPDICLVNFYTSSGKLGLHQDKDETKPSLHKGLPVVSFSLGDTAEFLYGDVNDVDKASKVDLESGDVLIFGGKSRLIFHGVSRIKPKTAPNWLTDEAKLRPGRLNLTFRQH
uniref:Fe2OG dioxygenase domain-containing protein n=1 Tax=Oryza nivara TaxID=4536 RepID=A0A0E0GVK0_ORYNI